MKELIITNGDSAAGLLKAAGIGDEILPWRDVLHDGPVPETEDLAALSNERAQFLGMAGFADPETVRQSFLERDAKLAAHADFDHVTLWFEHDLYDQLQLIQVLDWFSNDLRQTGSLHLVQADDYLGRQTKQNIGRFADWRWPVTSLQLSMARVAWTAFRQPTPEPWVALLAEDLSAMPYLRSAVIRMLEELPDKITGLTRIERETLNLIRAGVREPRHLFGAYIQTEEAEFLGDTSFFAYLDALAAVPTPLIENHCGHAYSPQLPAAARKRYLGSELAVSDFGIEVLAGRADQAAHNKINRWWGGTNLSGDNIWRWDGAAQELAAPA